MDILFPIIIFFLSAWLSQNIKSNNRWFIVFSFWFIDLIVITISLGFSDFIGNFINSLMGFIPSFIGVFLGPIILDIRENKKLSSVKRIIFNIICIIVLFFIFIFVQLGALYITGSIYGVYEIIEEKIETKPEYINNLPYLYDVIDEIIIPDGYISERYGKEDLFENITRASNDEQVLISVAVIEYKKINNFSLQDVVRLNAYENLSNLNLING